MGSDLVKRLQRRAEHGGVFHTDRKLFGEAATALAEQSRLNAEREAKAYRRGAEDEKDRLLAVCEDRQGDTTDAERWEEAVHSGCFLEDQGAMLPAERAAIRSLPADEEGA